MGALTVTVRSGARRTSYPIRIGRGLASSLGRSLAGLAGADRPIVVSSPRVWAAVGPRVEQGIVDAGDGAQVLGTLTVGDKDDRHPRQSWLHARPHSGPHPRTRDHDRAIRPRQAGQ